MFDASISDFPCWVVTLLSCSFLNAKKIRDLEGGDFFSNLLSWHELCLIRLDFPLSLML